MLLHHGCVIGLCTDSPYHAKRHRVFRKRHACEPVVNARVGLMGIVGKDILLGNTILANLYHSQLEVLQDDTLVAVLAK